MSDPLMSDPQPPIVVERPREPFWGYSDLLLFIGIAPVCLVFSLAVIRGLFTLLHIHPSVQVLEPLIAQMLGYFLLFATLAAIFRIWYARPFWHSLGWLPMRIPFSIVICAGMGAGIAVAVLSWAIHTPETPTPLTDLMKSRPALILMAVFGVTMAPICEELAFRGFLQPLLSRTFGRAPGIVLAAIPFGLLHFQEYGNSWRHVVLICLAGASFGVMKNVTGSTKAAALMHAAYNALFFLAVFSEGKDPHR